jgi:glycosyltransferase involved in cell wall biosynthesis
MEQRHLIVVPAYNEAVNLPTTILNLQSLPDHFEILVVNDGSLDDTSLLMRELIPQSRLKLHFVELATNCGIGAAVQTGYLFAARANHYQYVIQFDADGQHDAAWIQTIVDGCEQQKLDFCIGSRFLDRASADDRSSAMRRCGIRYLSTLIGLLSQFKISDPTSGFRCAGPRAWQAFARSYPEDYPEPEVAYWCLLNGLKVSEVPVVMHKRQAGHSSIRTLNAAYYMCKVTLALLVASLRGREVLHSEH